MRENHALPFKKLPTPKLQAPKKHQVPSQCIPKLSASERGVYAARPSLSPRFWLNSSLVGSVPLKRPEGRAPTNRQLLNARVPSSKPTCARIVPASDFRVCYLRFGTSLVLGVSLSGGAKTEMRPALSVSPSCRLRSEAFTPLQSCSFHSPCRIPLVGSFTLKRPDRRRAEAALFRLRLRLRRDRVVAKRRRRRATKAEGRAPTNRQLLDAPKTFCRSNSNFFRHSNRLLFSEEK